MSITDDKIQQLRRENRRRHPVDFTRPVLVAEQYYDFIRTILIEDTVSIMLPVDFVDMPIEMAKLKYLMENRPQIIKTSTDTAVNFTFIFSDEPFYENDISGEVKGARTFIKQMQPSIRFYNEKVEKSENITFGWFDLISPGMDTRLYTIIGYASINNKKLQCSFNCDYRLMNDWNPVAVKAFYPS